MALRAFQLEKTDRVEEREPQDPGLPADYLRWISFEGSCSLATEPPPKPKLPAQPEAERERARALEAPFKTLKGSE